MSSTDFTNILFDPACGTNILFDSACRISCLIIRDIILAHNNLNFSSMVVVLAIRKISGPTEALTDMAFLR